MICSNNGKIPVIKHLSNDYFLLQTAGTLVLHAAIPFVYLCGYSYFVFMEDPNGEYFKVSNSSNVSFSQGTWYIYIYIYIYIIFLNVYKYLS